MEKKKNYEEKDDDRRGEEQLLEPLECSGGDPSLGL